MKRIGPEGGNFGAVFVDGFGAVFVVGFEAVFVATAGKADPLF